MRAHVWLCLSAKRWKSPVPSIARCPPDADACNYAFAQVAEALEATHAVRISVCLGDFGASSKKPLQLLGAAP
eukprot:13534275-Alexandrium_andersonii.AAC.1